LARIADAPEGLMGVDLSAALAALKRHLAPIARVRRDGRWLTLPAAELVPGDVILLSLGALVPADARIAVGTVLVDYPLSPAGVAGVWLAALAFAQMLDQVKLLVTSRIAIE
jgi:hypothetical protein